MSVHWPIYRRLLRHPLRVAAVDDQRAWRGIDLLCASMHIADRIERESAGGKIGVMLPVGGVFGAVAMAAWTLGRTVVPLNFLLRQEEVDWIVNHSGVDLVLTSEKLEQHLGWSVTNARRLPLEEVNFSGIPPAHVPAAAASDELAALLYTSGTSGRPKGVMLTHGNIAANVEQVRRWVHLTPKDVILGALPQFHSFGFTVLTMLPLMTGMRAVYTSRWLPTKVFQLMREQRPTMFIGLPSMYNALLRVKNAGPEDFESFRYVVSGGEPLPDGLFNAFYERFGVRINEGYGLTETSPVTHWLRPAEFRRHSVGRALPGCRVRIVDPDTEQELGPNREGEIRIAGPNVMCGYYKDPAQTEAAFDEKGYFRTGDFGRVDADGFLYITGRMKEMLIVSGENVFPREIEEVLNRHPQISESGVVGEPDELRGEVPIAFVEMADDQPFDADEIRDFCAERLARHKSPRRIIRVDELPRNPTGKILRRTLREWLADEIARSEPVH